MQCSDRERVWYSVQYGERESVCVYVCGVNKYLGSPLVEGGE